MAGAPPDPELEPPRPTGAATQRALDLTPPRAGGLRRPEEWRRNLRDADVRDRHKRIVICADGTWNTPYTTSSGQPAPTNVWLLYQLVSEHASDGMPQLAYYRSGVGTGGVLDRVVGGAFGIGLDRNILHCYRFLVEQYSPGDHLYFFGFSRGAYTVRSLAGLVRNCGIIDRSRFAPGAEREAAIAEAFRLYRKRSDSTAPVANLAVDFRAAHSHPDFRIACIGVWDTVGSLGIPVGLVGRISSHFLYGFHDVTLSSWVDRAFHAIAVDERRRPFVPTLWEQQPGAREKGQHMEQVWFPGVHADVGGGYAWGERGLANLTLRWMVDRVMAHCGLELDAAPLLNAPDAPVAVHDSLSLWYRLFAPVARTIDGGLGKHGMRDPASVTRESAHESVSLLRARYQASPIPVVNRPYAPENLADYEERLARARRPSAAPATPYPSDVKWPPWGDQP